MPILRDRDTWIPLYILLLIVFIVKFGWKKGLVIIIASILCVTITDQISSSFFKPFFERLRPCQTSINFNLLVERCSSSFSFTSSHAANHFGLAILWSLFFWKNYKLLIPFLILWATCICFAQVYVGVHYPADILGGIILGVLIGTLLYKVSITINRKLTK